MLIKLWGDIYLKYVYLFLGLVDYIQKGTSLSILLSFFFTLVNFFEKDTIYEYPVIPSLGPLKLNKKGTSSRILLYLFHACKAMEETFKKEGGIIFYVYHEEW